MAITWFCIIEIEKRTGRNSMSEPLGMAPLTIHEDVRPPF